MKLAPQVILPRLFNAVILTRKMLHREADSDGLLIARVLVLRRVGLTCHCTRFGSNDVLDSSEGEKVSIWRRIDEIVCLDERFASGDELVHYDTQHSVAICPGGSRSVG